MRDKEDRNNFVGNGVTRNKELTVKYKKKNSTT